MTDNIKPTFLDASVQPDGKTADRIQAAQATLILKDAGYTDLSW